LFQVTSDVHWLVAAGELLDVALTHFPDGNGGFFDTADDADQLIARPRDPADNAAPAGQSALAGALLAYSALTGSIRHRDVADAAIKAAGNDYNTFIPIQNALGALGKNEALGHTHTQRSQVLEAHLREVPEDARARCLLAIDHAFMGRLEDANREANLAIALRPNDAMVLYNLACVFCRLDRKEDGMKTLRRAGEIGFRHNDWARNDPDLALLHGDPEFERLYPAPSA